jgi:hypothetical protein
MNKRMAGVVLGVAFLATLACGPLGNLGNLVTGSEAGTASSLWPDVPPYPGADKVDLEMPLVIRVAVEAASKAIMSEAGDAAGNLEFIAFTTNDSIEDVQAFYTIERMAGEGWTQTDAPGCGAASTGTAEIGGMCIFGKKGGAQDSALFVVVGGQDSGDTSIFYVRIDANPEAIATGAAQ